MNAELYCTSYNDLIMGTAVSVAYVKIGDVVGIFAKYLESATINYAQLVAINLGMEQLHDGYNYLATTNSKYASLVVLNCNSWNNQGILDVKAHSEQVKQILTHIHRLGTGEVQLVPYKRHSDELMVRACKHAKHYYYMAQNEMIKKQTTALNPNLFPDDAKLIDELQGSVIWKVPMSMSIFEKKMGKSRNEKPILRLVTGLSEVR
jgi:hypothetical protein